MAPVWSLTSSAAQSPLSAPARSSSTVSSPPGPTNEQRIPSHQDGDPAGGATLIWLLVVYLVDAKVVLPLLGLI